MNEEAAIYLDLVAAKAKQMATDLRKGKLWPGDLEQGCAEIRESLDKCGASSG